MKKLKRFLAATIVLVLLFTGIPQGLIGISENLNFADASMLEADDYNYEIVDGGVRIVRYRGSESNVIIPSTIEGYKVTFIGFAAFLENSTLETITLPDSITEIEMYAFYDCNNLKEIILPDGLTKIGSSAFCGCTSLTEIIIPGGVSIIEICTFERSGLKTVKLSEGVETIDFWAFYNCTDLISVELPSSLKDIDNFSFEQCTALTEYVVAEENHIYSSVDGVLFDKEQTTLLWYPINKDGENYTIPNSVTAINDYSFYGCKNLKVLNFNKMITEIGFSAFGNNELLMEINVDEENTKYSSIDGVLFNKDQSELLKYPPNKQDKSYTIPKQVNSIGFSAFSACNGLESLTISENVYYVSSFNFYNSMSLKEFIVSKDNKWYSSVDGVLFNKDQSKIIKYPAKKEGTAYEILNGVTTVGHSAFEASTILTAVTIPQSVTKIESSAFLNCINLKSVNIPKTVKEIEYDSFYGADNVTIYCAENSYAHLYAKRCEINCSLEGEPENTVIAMRLNSALTIKNSDIENKIPVDETSEIEAPFTLNTRTMVPVRFLENFGADVYYTSADEPVRIVYGDIFLIVEFDSDVMEKSENGKVTTVPLSTKATLVEGKTYLPYRELCEALGLSVEYEDANKEYAIVVSQIKLTDTELAKQVELANSLDSKVNGVKSIVAKQENIEIGKGAASALRLEDNYDKYFVYNSSNGEEVGCKKLTFATSNAFIATVSSKGKVTGVSAGKVTITATTHNGKTCTFNVTVK